MSELEMMMWEALDVCRNQMPLWWECLGAVGLSLGLIILSWESQLWGDTEEKRGLRWRHKWNSQRSGQKTCAHTSKRHVCFERCSQQPQVFPQSHVRIRSVREFSYEKTYWWPSHKQLLYLDFINIHLNRKIQHPFAKQSWTLIYHDRKFWSFQWLNWQH